MALNHRRRIRYSIHEPCTLARTHGSVRGRGDSPLLLDPDFVRGKHSSGVGENFFAVDKRLRRIEPKERKSLNTFRK
ncbi:hypothetical protein Kole_0500 [Kosmotoga olearia TBF 19.5.1]|uniref:Uncharacterized protein n=1 Tax=Kosmotoga olearia (strain ATCC BAA-1733 / DSM 21960 / TBF 19.5.1) TaxID=521045 RepID=C5CEH6_KOSOT|nr:hypothetical protein Kole_0500 [Kosmotoga olearia TBF 19.5.1]